MSKNSYSQVQQGRKVKFSDKVTRDIDGFTDESVVQCDVQVAKNIFVYYSK